MFWSHRLDPTRAPQVPQESLRDLPEGGKVPRERRGALLGQAEPHFPAHALQEPPVLWGSALPEAPVPKNALGCDSHSSGGFQLCWGWGFSCSPQATALSPFPEIIPASPFPPGRTEPALKPPQNPTAALKMPKSPPKLQTLPKIRALHEPRRSCPKRERREDPRAPKQRPQISPCERRRGSP